MKLRGLVIASLLGGLLASGCVVSPRGAHAIGQVAGAALWTAAVVGTVAVLTYHDAHHHHHHCGHYRQWHHGRWVYHYDGRWEYYDHGSATWYFYAE